MTVSLFNAGACAGPESRWRCRQARGATMVTEVVGGGEAAVTEEAAHPGAAATGPRAGGPALAVGTASVTERPPAPLHATVSAGEHP